jgi:hypothetical protein
MDCMRRLIHPPPRTPPVPPAEFYGVKGRAFEAVLTRGRIVDENRGDGKNVCDILHYVIKCIPN